MGIHTARIPENLDEYLKILIRKGYATSYGNAINLVILDRMMRDKEAGEIEPFKYKLKDARVGPGLDLSEIGTDNVEEPATFPLGEPPAIAGPLPAPSGGLSLPSKEEIIPEEAPKKEILPEEILRKDPARSEEAPTPPSKGYFGHMDKPRHPGTMEEYLKDRRRSEFLPPEE